VPTGFPSPTPLKAGSKKTPQSALEHYEAAVEHEASGDLGESLKLYRQAFRLDDRVDKVYKEKYFPAVKKTVDSAIAAVKAGDKEKGAAKKEKEEGMPSMSELVKSFASLGIEAERKPVVGGQKETETTEEEEGEKKFCLLAEVPGELLLQILRHLALTDVAAYVRLGQVCKHLCYVVSSEESIWAEVTRRTFKKQVWDWKVEVDGTELPEPEPFPEELAEVFEEEAEESDGELAEGEPERIIPVDNEELERYNGSWKEMFHLRPRLRFNGVYISTCNYHRAGGHMGSALTWGTPVHTVTYYRYLRFYPDGTLLSLLTTHGPAEVVYLFSKPSLLPAALKGHPTTSAIAQWAPYVSRGRWRLDHEGRVDIETEVRNLKRYLFRMQFRVRNVKGRGAVKLNWEGFWSWNKLTDDLAAFEGRNDKPFFFSRVVAAEKEMGVEL
jgi:F-box protein 9